jgi:hypothetical protein
MQQQQQQQQPPSEFPIEKSWQLMQLLLKEVCDNMSRVLEAAEEREASAKGITIQSDWVLIPFTNTVLWENYEYQAGGKQVIRDMLDQPIISEALAKIYLYYHRERPLEQCLYISRKNHLQYWMYSAIRSSSLPDVDFQ